MNAIKRLPTLLLFGVIVTVAACGGSNGTLGSVPPASEEPISSTSTVEPDLTPVPSATPTAVPSSEPSASAAPTTTPTAAPGETMIVRAYFVLGGDIGVEGLVPTLREVPKTVGVATAAMKALLAGPTAAQSGERTITSAIPDRSKLLGLTIKNGVATVDLSTEFDSGGGSASQQYRLAQVVYTLTQFSTVKSVVFQVEGQTVTVFGSEGILLDGPVGRADFYDQLPSMFVDRPAYGAALGNPGRVTGNANVFEATFRIAVLDAAGKTLVDRQVMATCGSGCRGTFDVTLTYSVAKGQWGTLRVYDPSEKDGSPQDIRDYPVWLTPAG
jgi:germination protein M